MTDNMTIEEAISYLEFDRDMITFDPITGKKLNLETIKLTNEINYKAYIADGIAIEALKKQLPLKSNNNYCPLCKSYIAPALTYCFHCGQKIDK